MKVSARRFVLPCVAGSLRQCACAVLLAAAMACLAPANAAVPVDPSPASQAVPPGAPADASPDSPADVPFVPGDEPAYPGAETFLPHTQEAPAPGTIDFSQIALLGLAAFGVVIYMRRRQRRRVGWGVLPERPPVIRDPGDTRP